MRTAPLVLLVTAALLLGAGLQSFSAAAQSPQMQKKAWLPTPAGTPTSNVGPTLPPEPTPVPTPPQSLPSDAMQADPALLLGRIRDLEARLARAEKQLAALDGHTHDYGSPAFDTTVTYDQLLQSPDKYKAARVSLNFGNKYYQSVQTGGPKPKQP